MSRVNSSCTTLMKAWPGVRLLVTSTPIARALTASVKLLTTPKRDIGVEQREANLADRIGNIVVGEPAAAGQRLERGGKAGGESVEHGAILSYSIARLAGSSAGSQTAAGGARRSLGACVIIESLRPAVILAITLFLLYGAGAWAMLRSVNKPRLEPLAWLLMPRRHRRPQRRHRRHDARQRLLLHRPARGHFAARLDLGACSPA